MAGLPPSEADMLELILQEHVRRHVDQGGAPLAPEELETMRTKIADVVAAKRRAGGSGVAAEALRRLRIIVAHGVREALLWLVDIGPLQGADAAGVAQCIRQICAQEGTEDSVACIRVDFVDAETGSPGQAYIRLDVCPRDHDFGAQLDAAQQHIPAGRMAIIREHITQLVNCARAEYARVFADNSPAMNRALGAKTAAEREPSARLSVDPANTTLYAHADHPQRLGVFVQLAIS